MYHIYLKIFMPFLKPLSLNDKLITFNHFYYVSINWKESPGIPGPGRYKRFGNSRKFLS